MNKSLVHVTGALTIAVLIASIVWGSLSLFFIAMILAAITLMNIIH